MFIQFLKRLPSFKFSLAHFWNLLSKLTRRFFVRLKQQTIESVEYGLRNIETFLEKFWISIFVTFPGLTVSRIPKERLSRRKVAWFRRIAVFVYKTYLPKENNTLVGDRRPTQYQQYGITLCVVNNHLFSLQDKCMSNCSGIQSEKLVFY